MNAPLFKKVLVANRSEIAVRIMHACRTMGIRTVAVYSDADVNSKHRYFADEAIQIGPSSPRESYLNIDRIMSAASQTGADAIHPGYGFLAENPMLPERCAKEGILFIGPGADSMRLMGNKVESRIKMNDVGVPLIPGMNTAGSAIEDFEQHAKKIGYPVMIKAAAGGGGKGMRVVHRPEELADSIDAARREAGGAFDDDTIYLEKYITNARHIEFQILADSTGECVHLFERECSIQRRHQKIIEETPSVALDDNLRTRMGADAVKVAHAASYTNAGTVEFLLDESGHYYFLEMNTRIQVEHPITEAITGLDLVAEQIRIASGQPLSDAVRNARQSGHAIECRIYAEDGENNFLPSGGTIEFYREPAGPGVRVDSGVMQGSIISIDYDPIIAKLIVHAPDRETAIARMVVALNDFKILGVKTSKRFMVDCLTHPAFVKGETDTAFIETHMGERNCVDEKLTIAAVAAAGAEASLATAISANLSDETRSVNLWQMLGPWQIGDAIDGNA